MGFKKHLFKINLHGKHVNLFVIKKCIFLKPTTIWHVKNGEI
jgi:hypothetical protein